MLPWVSEELSLGGAVVPVGRGCSQEQLLERLRAAELLPLVLSELLAEIAAELLPLVLSEDQPWSCLWCCRRLQSPERQK